MSAKKQNLIVYSIFLLIACIGILYGQQVSHLFNELRVWRIENILWLGIGIPFLFFQKNASLPNFFESSISNKARFFEPAFIGVIFGILDIIVIKVIQHPEPYTQLPPFLQPFPYSVFLYFSGALEIEVFYRLIPLTIILIIGKQFAAGKYFNYFLWTGFITTSIREPLEQFPSGTICFIIYAFVTGFLMNYIQAFYYKKAGFIASLTLRLGHYLFWHILLGIYVQYFELVK